MKLLWLSLNCIPHQWVCFALAKRHCAKEIALPFGSVCLGLGGYWAGADSDLRFLRCGGCDRRIGPWESDVRRPQSQ